MADFTAQVLRRPSAPVHGTLFALDFLRSELPGVSLAVLGNSRGSEAAMLTAIHSALRVRGVVAMVPGNVVAGSWPSGGPAWLLDGRALPYVGHCGPEDANALIPVELVA